MAIGLVCGLRLLHWFALCFLSLALSAAMFASAPWDFTLVPKWLGALTVFQFSYLLAAGIRLWWTDLRSVRHEPEPNAEPILAGERVLIVEDDPLTAALLAGEVEGASGHPVGPAASVADALQHISDEKVDAAVLDLKLADGDGTAVALTLMERGVPFVIVSARSSPPEIVARDPGVRVFRKPVTLAAPVRGLAQEIRRKSSGGMT